MYGSLAEHSRHQPRLNPFYRAQTAQLHLLTFRRDNLGGILRNICSPDVRNVSALEVFGYKSTFTYLLTYLLTYALSLPSGE